MDTRLAAVPDPKSFDSLFAELSAKVAASRHEFLDGRRGSTPAYTRSARRSSRRPPRSGWPPSTRARTQAAEEISQLLYHLQVLMLALDLDLDDVYDTCDCAHLR